MAPVTVYILSSNKQSVIKADELEQDKMGKRKDLSDFDQAQIVRFEKSEIAFRHCSAGKPWVLVFM